MSFLKKSVSLLAFFAVIPAAYAVTARPSVMNAATAASRRLPTLTAYINSTPASRKARAQVSRVTPVVRISSIKMTFFGSVSFFSADFLENFFAKE